MAINSVGSIGDEEIGSAEEAVSIVRDIDDKTAEVEARIEDKQWDDAITELDDLIKDAQKVRAFLEKAKEAGN